MADRRPLWAILAASMLSLTACKTSTGDRSTESGISSVTLPAAIDYSKMSDEEALDMKLKMMLPHARGKYETEIMSVIHKGLVAGRKSGKFKNVSIEDLMAHARQEGNVLINALEFGWDLKKLRANGTNLWDIWMDPSNDLLGNISWSLWQTTSNNYLRYGKDFDPGLMQLFNDYIVKYGLTGPLEKASDWDIAKASGAYRKNIKTKLGAEPGQALLDKEREKLSQILPANPQLHILTTAALVQANYEHLGTHAPNAIRSYYWLDHQKNLVPSAWLGTVHDSNIQKRGDYGKQVMLGNESNDRGFVFWYAVTGDRAALTAMLEKWSSDPAKISKADYQQMKDKGLLKYSEKNPELYTQISALLP